MLVSFSVANFRSFGEEVTLNMVASNKLADHQTHCVPINGTGKAVLRAAVIYGANAAGKSNLIKAMGVAQRLVLDGIDRTSAVEPFSFDDSISKQPSSFEFRFLLGDRIFAYGFDIARTRFVSEWLAIVKADDELVSVYERDETGQTTINDSSQRYFEDDKVMFETLDKLISIPLKRNQLLLGRVNSVPESSQGTVLASIIRWLTKDLLILSADYRTCDILDRLESDSAFRTFCSTFLSNVGTGIGQLSISESERDATERERHFLPAMIKHPELFGLIGCEGDTDIRPNPSDPTKVIVRRLFARHHEYSLPFGEESDGTQQLLHLMPVLSSAPEQSRVVVIDELDRSLHPLICWEFIRFFSESCPGARKQLIVTTHEAHLLDQELLRRDEYWFVEKDQSQQSRLVSLLEFNIRKDLKVQKGYLQGRFGAIPIIGGMDALERLLNCTEAPHATEETTA